MAIGGGKSGGGGASSGLVRAGGAFVEIFGKDRLSPLLDALKAKMNAFGSFLTKAGGAGLAAGTAILAPITGLFTAAVDRGKELQILADRMGATTESVSALAYAFETIGVPIDQFGDAVKGLQQKLSAAADGQDETFRRMKLNVRELIDLPLDEQFGRIAESLSRMEKPADQARFAMESLGEVGLKLLPALKNGAFDLAALRQEAADVGAVMSGEDAKRATEVAKSTAKAWSAIKYAVMEVGMALLPQSGHIKEFSGWVTSLARQTREWIADNRALVLTVVGIGAGLAAAGAALVAFGVVAKATAAGLAIVTATLGAASAAVGVAAAVFAGLKAVLLALPFTAVVAGVAGIGYALSTQTDAGRGMLARLKTGFGELADTARTAWGGIAAAISKGDVQAAFGIATAALRLEWAKVVAFWTAQWNAFKGVFVEGWHTLADRAQIAWLNLKQGLAENFSGLIRAWDATTDTLGKAWAGFADYVEKVWDGTAGRILGRFEDVSKKIKALMPTTQEALIGGKTPAGASGWDRIKMFLFGQKLAGVSGGGGFVNAAADSLRKALAPMNALRQVAGLFVPGLGGAEDPPEKTARQKLDAEQAAAAAARAAAREKDLAAARADIAREEAELRERVRLAGLPRPGPGAGGGGGAAGPGFFGERFGDLLRQLQGQLRSLPDTVKGAFNPTLAKQQFGYGDRVGQRSLTAQETTAKAVKDMLPKINDGVRNLTKALAFK